MYSKTTDNIKTQEDSSQSIMDQVNEQYDNLTEKNDENGTNTGDQFMNLFSNPPKKSNMRKNTSFLTLDVGEQIFDRIFKNVKNLDDDKVNKNEFLKRFKEMGILSDDPRAKAIFEKAELLPNNISEQELEYLIKDNLQMTEKILAEELIMPEFQKFKKEVHQVYKDVKLHTAGKVADYIPQLAIANPNHFGVSICTIDGQRFGFGETNQQFSVQSTSKPISYCVALENLGHNKVHKHVGMEPSGVEFNAISLNRDGKPHNPLINAGAIMICSLLKPELEDAERFSYQTRMWEKLCAGKKINYDNTVFLSERGSADTNFALAYLMKSRGAFPEDVDIQRTLEFYFQQCSLECDTDKMSIIAATLANGGLNPLTGEQVFKIETVRNCLSLMNSCGMYDYSGEFAFRVGLPAKSGVSGAIMTVVPGVMGFCTYSPPLDKYGNSSRGVQFCEIMAKKFSLHYFQIDKGQDLRIRKIDQKFDYTIDLIKYSACGDAASVKRLLLTGVDPKIGDYDNRTPIHLAASQG